MYDRSVQFWVMLHEILNQLPRREGGRDHKKSLFWSAHQRFYRQMLLGGKVRHSVIHAFMNPSIHSLVH
jgi:hypothetical protein